MVDFICVTVEDLCHFNNFMLVNKASFFSGVSENSDQIYFLLVLSKFR